MPNEAEKRFIDAWRFAAPLLEKIRHQELRQLDESAGLKMIGAHAAQSNRLSGLIDFQAWMMRLRVKQLQDQLAVQHESGRKQP